MVSLSLKKRGKIATAVDVRDTGFDPRAVSGGVQFFQMDVSSLKFEDEKFDFIFSYDTFEHFSHPDSALSEILRVMKIDGYCYLEFGPLYQSAFGLHAYRQIYVPYSQFLFSKDTMNAFCLKNGIELIDFQHCNGWTLSQFKKLIELHSSIELLRFEVQHNYSHLDLVVAYPSCFKSKTDDFENLTAASLKILFKKTTL